LPKKRSTALEPGWLTKLNKHNQRSVLETSEYRAKADVVFEKLSSGEGS
jgi:hypothetical protein